MKHAVIMKRNMFKTVCDISFHGHLLKGKKCEHRTLAEINTIECPICREKVISLRSKRSVFGIPGGRCIIIDLEDI